MNIQEKIKIAKKLQEYDYLFRVFWDLGDIRYTSDIETAAIRFDKNGHSLEFLLNENWFKNLDSESQLFVICHECFHVLLNHGERFLDWINDKKFQTVNIAADIVINEMLISSFFDGASLNPEITEKGCFIATVFGENCHIKTNQSTEYYYNKLIENSFQDGLGFDRHLLDLESLKDINDFIDLNDLGELIKEFMENNDGGIIGSSKSSKGHKHLVNAKKQMKKKWESVIVDWSKVKLKEGFEMSERWDRYSPRYGELLKSSNVKIPTNNFIIDSFYEKDKIEVFFFLDASGSCINLKDRFFNAALSLNPKKFSIRLFSFDTSVKQLDVKTCEVYGGGGTSFHIIEDTIQDIIKMEKIKYPDAVFIITDGEGDRVDPQKPKNWFWFLSQNYTKFIPNESKVFKLSDYE